MRTPLLVFVVNVHQAARRRDYEVAVRVEPVDLLIATVASDHQRGAHAHRVCSEGLHEGLDLDCQLAIGNNHQYNVICEGFVCIVLFIICIYQTHIIELEKDEWEHVGKCLSASRVALQNRIPITQNARNLS